MESVSRHRDSSLASAEEFVPTRMAVTVHVTLQLLHNLAAQYGDHGIEFDTDNDTLVCVACSTALEAWQVDAHVRLPSHCVAVESREGLVDEGTEVTINGIPMLLDSSCIFPRTMFGAGRILFDDTLKCLIAPDVTGAVDLRSGHEYTVVEMNMKHSDPERFPLSRARPRSMAYFVAQPRENPSRRNRSEPTVASTLRTYWDSQAKLKKKRKEKQDAALTSSAPFTVTLSAGHRRERRLSRRRARMSQDGKRWSEEQPCVH